MLVVSSAIVGSGWRSNPGELVGTRNMVRPLCLGSAGSVRVRRKTCVAYWALEVKIFCPLMTHSSPSRTARVFALAMSDPPSGSV